MSGFAGGNTVLPHVAPAARRAFTSTSTAFSTDVSESSGVGVGIGVGGAVGLLVGVDVGTAVGVGVATVGKGNGSGKTEGHGATAVGNPEGIAIGGTPGGHTRPFGIHAGPSTVSGSSVVVVATLNGVGVGVACTFVAGCFALRGPHAKNPIAHTPTMHRIALPPLRIRA